jgi:hypothetical protein
MPGIVGQIVSSFIGALERVEQGVCLFLSRLEFDCNSQLHTPITPLTSRLDKKGERSGLSPKDNGSAHHCSIVRALVPDSFVKVHKPRVSALLIADEDRYRYRL